MIVAFSTSSPESSVALLEAGGEVIATGSLHAPMGASGACLQLLEQLLADSGRRLEEATLFVSDLGPGSFTGVKVGVTLAKTFAFALGARAAGLSSFDLIDRSGLVVLPSKRGEYFVRHPGSEPVRTEALPQGPFKGYGPGIEPETFPAAERFAPLLAMLTPMQPELLVPNYLIEPSISQPKKPYASPGAHG